MAGKCRWCGKPTRKRYCYRHIALGRVLDDVIQQIEIVEKMRNGQLQVNLGGIRDNLNATRVLIEDGLGES